MGNFVLSEGLGGTPGAHAWPGRPWSSGPGVVTAVCKKASPHEPNRDASWTIYQLDHLGTQLGTWKPRRIRRGPENQTRACLGTRPGLQHMDHWLEKNTLLVESVACPT